MLRLLVRGGSRGLGGRRKKWLWLRVVIRYGAPPEMFKHPRSMENPRGVRRNRRNACHANIIPFSSFFFSSFCQMSFILKTSTSTGVGDMLMSMGADEDGVDMLCRLGSSLSFSRHLASLSLFFLFFFFFFLFGDSSSFSVLPFFSFFFRTCLDSLFTSIISLFSKAPTSTFFFPFLLSSVSFLPPPSSSAPSCLFFLSRLPPPPLVLPTSSSSSSYHVHALLPPFFFVMPV